MKKVKFILGMLVVASVALSGLGFIIHGAFISNIGECFIGLMMLVFAWVLFTDKEYKKYSLKDLIYGKND